MGTIGEFLSKVDIVRYLLAIVIVALTIMIIWILMRELRLWYWKTNESRKSLKKIERRMENLELNLRQISSNVESISENTEVFKHMSVNMKESDEEQEDEE